MKKIKFKYYTKVKIKHRANGDSCQFNQGAHNLCDMRVEN